jgi:hypothetical protein
LLRVLCLFVSLDIDKNLFNRTFMNCQELFLRTFSVGTGVQPFRASLSFDPEVSLRAERTQCEAGPKGRTSPCPNLETNPFHPFNPSGYAFRTSPLTAYLIKTIFLVCVKSSAFSL